MPLAQWIHVVVVVKANQPPQFYINGRPPEGLEQAPVYQDKSRDGKAPTAGDSVIAIGHAPFSSRLAKENYSEHWEGGLDDIAIYPDALTPDEVAAHHAAGLRETNR